LGGPNFQEIPINRPVVAVHNNQRDGHMRQTINKGRSSYNPNSIGGGCPFQAGRLQGGFTSYAEKIDAHKIRARSKSFFDHFSQAKLFYQSQSDPEKNHILSAFTFELGKCETEEIRQRMVGIISLIDRPLATAVALNLGLQVPAEPAKPINHLRPADVDPKEYEPIIKESPLKSSKALSTAFTVKDSIKTRMIAFLVADGVNAQSVTVVQKALLAQGAVVHIIAPRLGFVTAEDGTKIPVSKSLLTVASVLYDAVYVPGGAKCVAALAVDPDVIHFLNESYRHCKAIAAHTQAEWVLKATYFGQKVPSYSDKPAQADSQGAGVILHADLEVIAQQFINSIKQHRFWEREMTRNVPA